MSPKQLLDPLAMWREAIDRLEGGINAVATRNMETEKFSQALALVLRAGLGTQHLFDKNLARLYERLGLPSRSELEAVAATMRRIEDKLDLLLPAPVPAHRPARTKRAPVAAPALAAHAASAEAKVVTPGDRAATTAPSSRRARVSAAGSNT
ncbi:hypothetical protein [Variovorax rhizosphaerae]|uniref:Poly(3-hydroxyalkanoate) polymerase subunit PhaE n=1 Tax=Variovorax rhizosphaerae TaxID=1836200 RepID=A0ABU8WM20_9BURK